MALGRNGLYCPLVELLAWGPVRYFRFIEVPVLGLADIGTDRGPCGPGGRRWVAFGGQGLF